MEQKGGPGAGVEALFLLKTVIINPGINLKRAETGLKPALNPVQEAGMHKGENKPE